MAFTGTARFTLLDTLGEGGMGIVYEAYDHTREMRVALKTLRHVDATGLYRFKREFRALSDLSHPNIVALYELFAEDDNWFLTMELVDGRDFISYIRDDRVFMSPLRLIDEADTRTSMVVSGSSESLFDSAPTPEGVHADDGGAEPGLPILPDIRPHVADIADMERLRESLGQLARALHALHSAGMVHRDLKPSNVRVTGEGRVVLMDFGIVAESDEPSSPDLEDLAVGTPWFMAPEQASGGTPTAAADWYAFGVMMYMALTGRLPYEGPPELVLAAKKERDPLLPSALADGIPADLETLCMHLLARPPTRRPSSSAVLEQLGMRSRSSTSGDQGSADGDGDLFVGRTRELEILREIYVRMLSGTTTCVLVQGISGMGKTSLMECFFDELRAAGPEIGDPFLLSGRCHERESLSYKAFDGVIDSLSYHLVAMPRRERERAIPADIGLLARLFPVLQRIPGGEVPVAIEGRNQLDLRRQAMIALRSLLARLAEIHPIVIRIEDVQWADPDSLELLKSLFEPVAPRGILVVCTLRSEALEGTDNLPLIDTIAALEGRQMCQKMTLGPLSATERRELVRRLVPSNAMLSPISEQLWAESGGHPMLLAELARYAQEEPSGLAPAGRMHLEDVIWRRVGHLPEPVRLLIETIAMAGEPTPLKVLAVAAEISEADRERASTILCVGHLARVARSSAEPWLDAFHDKVREAIVERLPADRAQALHARLARALEDVDGISPATIARHWQAAGEASQASRYLIEAATSAAEQLAFDRAAKLYRRVLAVVPEGSRDRVLDRARCRAWIGLAQGMRVIDNDDQAMMLLDEAEPVASAHGLHEELAELHYLRGNLLFPRGDIDGCLWEHDRSRRYARLAGSAVGEARSLSGLGDALYLRGRMISAYFRFDECIELCRRHGFVGIEAANLSMRGLTRYYQTKLEAGLGDGKDAVALAARVGNRRAEIVARSCCVSWILIDMGRLSDARSECERALQMTRELGPRRFEPFSLSGLAKILAYRGQRGEAQELAARSVKTCRETGMAFVGPLALGVLALVTDDAEVRRRALAEGQQMLSGDVVGHNYLHFYRDAMEAALASREPDEADRYAGLLDSYIRKEALPWTRFFIARARVLARWLRGDRTAELAGEIVQLIAEAQRTELIAAVAALEQALEQVLAEG